MTMTQVDIILHDIRRATPDQVAAFAGVASSIAANLGGEPRALPHLIRRLCGQGIAVGSAITASAAPNDNLAVFAALAEARAGDILVLAANGGEVSAVIGDRVATIAARIGLAAIVTDGLARDLAGLKEIGLPVHAAGLSPISPSQAGPASVGDPITIGGTRIACGDMIVADDDGIAIIPQGGIAAALERLPAVLRADEEANRAVRDGAPCPPKLAALLGQAKRV